MINFFSTELRDESLGKEILSAISGVVDSGHYIRGNQLKQFERDFADYLGASGAVGVANGLDGLQLALRALGIGHGDEVIVPGFTFIATWFAVSQVGATPVAVDVDIKTANISFSEILNAVTPRTKAVIIVHLYGRVALDEIQVKEIQNLGIKVIEDAAQAHGAETNGKKIGTLGDLGVFSFYPTKNLGCLGDGGAVVSNNAELLGRVTSLANYGSEINKYTHNQIGFNSRLDEIQAAVLNVFLPRLDEWNLNRVNIANHYKELFAKLDRDFKIIDDKDRNSVWHHFVIRTENREEFINRALLKGLELQIHYPIAPMDQNAYLDSHSYSSTSSLANSKTLAKEVVSLPMYPQLSKEKIEKIVDIVSRL